MTTTTKFSAPIEALLEPLTTDAYTGQLSHDDALTVLLAILDQLRGTGRQRTSVRALHRITHTRIPQAKVIGGHDRILQLLGQAEELGEIRMTGQQVILGDAPQGPGTGSGLGHVWARYTNQRGAVVEIVGAKPWPATEFQPAILRREDITAWWWCTGCRDGHPYSGEHIDNSRKAAAAHAAACTAQPALPDPAAG
ncbi:hypothetical protein ACIA8O_38790 [Kitasatospora sp. NPDC051853]|uniref:hypothetical protein n=1 Tax=Kitasatospora sp. NPDC051853 TaxID=3364058 RepID=UPI0037A26976